MLSDRLDSLEIYALWVAPSGEVFVGHKDGTAILDRDGAVRIVSPTNVGRFSPVDIYGFSANNVYVLEDSDYRLLHWNGTSLEVQLAFDDVECSVWGPAPNNVMVAGGDAIHHYDGRSWLSISTGTSGIRHIGGAGDTIYAVGFGGGRARVLQ